MSVNLRCAFEGCGRRSNYGVYCAGHNAQKRRRETLRPIKKYNLAVKTWCTFEGCKRVRSANGLCSTHNAQRTRGKELTPIRKTTPVAGQPGTEPVMDPSQQCSFDGCGRYAVALKLCQTHWAQHRKGQELRPVRPYKSARPQMECTYEACNRMQYAKELCRAHHRQYLRNGSLNDLRPVGPNAPAECTFEGCGRKVSARGLCSAHWYQQQKGQELRPVRGYGRNAVCAKCEGKAVVHTSGEPLCGRHYSLWYYHRKNT